MTRRGDASRLGFTLIEILIVLVLLGITAGIAVLSFDMASPSARLRQESERIKALLMAASDYSLLHQQSLGISVARDHYTLVEFDETARRWIPSSRLGKIEKPEGEIIFSVAANENDTPALIIYPDGTIGEFSLALGWKDDSSLHNFIAHDKDGTTRTGP